MTLSTDIYIHHKVDPREVFTECLRLLGANEGVRTEDDPAWGGKEGSACIMTTPGQGLDAWTMVHYSADGSPLRTDATAHGEFCDEDCSGTRHKPEHWVRVNFDTAYGYSGPEGGCGDLHARLVAQLGRWLDKQDITWTWRNEFTGELHPGYTGLEELSEGGRGAVHWLRSTVLPAIEADIRKTGN